MFKFKEEVVDYLSGNGKGYMTDKQVSFLNSLVSKKENADEVVSGYTGNEFVSVKEASTLISELLELDDVVVDMNDAALATNEILKNAKSVCRKLKSNLEFAKEAEALGVVFTNKNINEVPNPIDFLELCQKNVRKMKNN